MTNGVSFLTMLAMACAVSAISSAEAKPDVLVILTDQWSPRYTSWDNPQVRTPNLDRLAREGMIFDACYTPSPVCMPARISLITGLFPHNAGHSVWGNVTEYFVPPDAAPMFRDIKSAGYSTAQIGKTHWTSGPAWRQKFKTEEDYYHVLGLDHVMDVSGPVDSPKERNPYAQYLQQKGLLETVAADLKKRYLEWEYEPRVSLASPEDYHDTFVTRAAVDYIGQQAKDKPMCLVVSLHSPHPPLDAPGEFATMFKPEELNIPANVPEQFFREGHLLRHADMQRLLANYLGKIALVDSNVGKLIDAMKQRGTWDNTLVCFTADHGEMMGAHGYLTKGRFYEESARVPLFIRWPGHALAGRTKTPVQMMDVYPTIVEAIGGKLSPGRFAKSLLPVVTGEKPSVRDVAISEIGKGSPLNMMARDSRYKWWAEDEHEYLFDLENDPLELHNLADDPKQSDLLSQMRNKMLIELRTMQSNLAEGYIPKVQRIRAEEAARSGTSTDEAPAKKPKKKKNNP